MTGKQKKMLLRIIAVFVIFVGLVVCEHTGITGQTVQPAACF